MRGQREHAGMITMAPAFLTCTPQNNFIGHSEGKRWNRNFAGIGLFLGKTRTRYLYTSYKCWYTRTIRIRLAMVKTAIKNRGSLL